MSSQVVAAGIIDLGTADEVAFAQPTVQVGVAVRGQVLPLAPNNEFLLDTGASGILLAKTASDDLAAAGLQTVATYTDFGVAGAAATGVSEPCTFAFAGANGVPLSLAGVRLQSSQQQLGTYPGIGGMPLMMGRTVTLDLSQQANTMAPAMTVAFDAPLAGSVAHRYSVPLAMVTFPQTGRQNPTDPLPENAPLPFAAVTLRSGTTVRSGSFLLDTGAQQCILSSSTAFALGLDRDGDGTFDAEATSFQTVAGVGGQTQIPVLTIDALSLPTANAAVDFVQRDVSVGIIDIDPSIAGVLGFNFLNKGWEVYAVNMFLGLDPPGASLGRASAAGAGGIACEEVETGDAFTDRRHVGGVPGNTVPGAARTCEEPALHRGDVAGIDRQLQESAEPGQRRRRIGEQVFVVADEEAVGGQSLLNRRRRFAMHEIPAHPVGHRGTAAGVHRGDHVERIADGMDDDEGHAEPSLERGNQVVIAVQEKRGGVPHLVAGHAQRRLGGRRRADLVGVTLGWASTRGVERGVGEDVGENLLPRQVAPQRHRRGRFVGDHHPGMTVENRSEQRGAAAGVSHDEHEAAYVVELRHRRPFAVDGIGRNAAKVRSARSA